MRQRNNKRKFVPDPCYLACQHHTYMSVGIQLINKENNKDVLLIGLGGGGLCSFLNHSLPDIKLTAVEIDPAMVEVAKEYFGLKTEGLVNIAVEDGLNFIKNSAEKGIKYKAILFDVDSKDTNVGMSCPPQSFLEGVVLKNVCKCIGNEGIFILNLVLRDETLRDSIIKSLKAHFKTILSNKLEEDLNEILYCKSNKIDVKKFESDIKTAADELNKTIRKKKIQSDDFVDVESLMESLTIYS